jgi:hypothetical protein
MLPQVRVASFWVATALLAPNLTWAESDAPIDVEGVVTDVSSRWSETSEVIITTSTLRTAAGEEYQFRQLGGSIDGLGMVMSHMPAVPRPGEVVQAKLRLRPSAHKSALYTVLELHRPEPLSLPIGEAPPPGYVSTRTNMTGTPLYWDSACVFIRYDSAGSTQVDGEFEVADQVFQRWRTDTESCSFLRFVIEPPVARDIAGNDLINLLKFREESWCPPGVTNPDDCYNRSAAGLTTLLFVDDPGSSRDGEILDADIQINGVNFAVSINGQTRGSAPCIADLANTLTHEVGHLIGLDHTCWNRNEGGTQPISNTGALVPDCLPSSSLSPEITEATMYNFQECGETKKASPEPDDILAYCETYPLSSGPRQCSRPSLTEGCCAVIPTGPASGVPSVGGLLLAAVAGLLTVRLRRRRSRR